VVGDLVESMEIVNPKGAIVTISDKQELRAAAGCLGLLGPVVSLTLRLVKTKYTVLEPKIVPGEQGIPRIGSSDTANINIFNADASKYYCEWFWFPGNAKKTLWINCWNDNGKKQDAKDYPSKFEAQLQGLGLVMADTLAKILDTHLFTKTMADLSMTSLPKEPTSITTQVANGLHFARGIQNIHLLNIEWHIGIPKKAGTNNPDFDIARKAWWVIMDRISQQQAEKDYSLCIMEMRVAKGSEMILSPLRRTEQYEWFIAIEVLGSNVKENVPPFFNAVQQLSDALRENGLEFMFHWPKLWNQVIEDGEITSARQYMKNFTETRVNGQIRIDEFKAIYDKIVARSGLKPSDYKMFSNQTLDFVFANLFQ